MSEHALSKRHLAYKLGLGAALAVGLAALAHYAQRHIAVDKKTSRPARKEKTDAPVATGEPGPGLRLGQILIPVAHPDTACALTQVASALGAGEIPSELIALKVVVAPPGDPLDEARRYRLAMRENYGEALSRAAAWAAEQGVPLRTEVQVSPDVATGILSFAHTLPDLGLIILGWRGPVSRRRVRHSINQKIVSHAKTHVAVLHERGLQSIRRVLVPVGWGPHARLGLRLAERLAISSRAAVTVLRVLPPVGEVDWESERAALVQLLGAEAPALRYDTELRLARGPAVVSAILEEARREPYDLLIIGASDEWWVRTWLFGAIPDQIAEQAPCSVLLVRRYEPGLLEGNRGL